MPIDSTQPVYEPPPGYPVESPWGVQTAEHVLQRFLNVQDRDLKWTNPPHGAHCVTLDTDTVWFHNGTIWVGQTWIGLCTYNDLVQACNQGICEYGDLKAMCVSPGGYPSDGATAGTPGFFTPPGSVVPTDAATANNTGVLASPTTAWTAGQYVMGSVAGPQGDMHWNGTIWTSGKA